LITDGEDHDPQAVTLAQQLAANGVMINTVGIGSAEGAPIMDPATNEYKKDENGNTVVSRLNETVLQQLAGATKGVYVKLNEVDATVDAITKQLNTIESSSLDDNAFRDYQSYFQWFLAIAFVFLLIEFFLPERKFKAA
jgi:Ca-activated chloride channel family protein